MNDSDSNRAEQVKQRLTREYNIKVLDKWLSGCVSLCLKENPKISSEGLFQFVLTQWLLVDLNDVAVGVLPSTLNEKTEAHTLSGTFPVQMQSLIDISEPAYDQWRRLYNKKLDKAEDEVQMRMSQAPQTKKRRMLKLELTDGIQQTVAMEHKPIPCLSTKLVPGVKLLLTGTIRCINKVLLLESKNVRVLGGAVDTLVKSNAYENVLLRALNKPANPNLKIDYEEAEVVENKHRPNHSSIQVVPMDQHRAPFDDRNNHSVKKSPPSMMDDVDVDTLLMGIDLDVIDSSQEPYVSKYRANKPKQVASISTLVKVPHDPEIMHQHVSLTKPSQPSPRTVESNSAKPSFPEQSELRGIHVAPQPDNDLEELEPPRVQNRRIVNDQLPSRSQEASSSKMLNRLSASALFEDSMDDCMELNELESSPNILSRNYAFRIGDTNLVTMEQLMALSEDSRSGRLFVVYLKVRDVTEHPRIRKDCWHLGVELTDSLDQILKVRLHNDVIAKMVRHDAGELMRMYKTDREGVMKMLDSILADFMYLIMRLQIERCFWRVLFPTANASELPLVLETYEMNDERWAIYLDKIRKENL